ncbi:MAG TPA: GTP-binding protein [Burkholderiales bacterium]|nr:GTP-binding protein [Burkholderiales bacterium]
MDMHVNKEIERAGVEGAVLRFITCGSVDDGKSTLIGRMLHDSRQVLEDQLAAVEKASTRRGMAEVDLSLLTDGLEAEREQGITIDVAYRYFSTARRKFIIADTPGHEQYTRNMATGASTAHAAIALCDASKGLLEQSRRHLYIAHLLGIRHLIVAVNKMDLVGYDQKTFERIRADFCAFADKLEGKPALRFIPLSAFKGDMVVDRGDNLDWYKGPALLELLETLEPEVAATEAPFRFPVQLVQRDAERGRTYLGRVASGRVKVGQAIKVLPGAVETTVKAIYSHLESRDFAEAGESVAISLHDERDIVRGDLISEAERPSTLERGFDATLVWMSTDALKPGGRYLIKHTSRVTKAKIARVNHLVDIKTLDNVEAGETIGVNSIVKATLNVQQPLAIDAYAKNRTTGAFILIDEASNQTVAAGMIG